MFTFLDLLDIVLEAIIPPTQRIVFEIQLRQLNQPGYIDTESDTHHRESRKKILHEERYLDRLLKIS